LHKLGRPLSGIDVRPMPLMVRMRGKNNGLRREGRQAIAFGYPREARV
jgi:hypothetical protein